MSVDLGVPTHHQSLNQSLRTFRIASIFQETWIGPIWFPSPGVPASGHNFTPAASAEHPRPYLAVHRQRHPHRALHRENREHFREEERRGHRQRP